MVSVTEQLRQNNPARTRFSILLRRETSDAEVAHQLGYNKLVPWWAIPWKGQTRGEAQAQLTMVSLGRDNQGATLSS